MFDVSKPVRFEYVNTVELLVISKANGKFCGGQTLQAGTNTWVAQFVQSAASTSGQTSVTGLVVLVA